MAAGNLPTARSVAETVVARVLDDGAFAAAALESEIERHVQLDPRDRGLATELVYGTLRVFPFLEQRLDAYATKSVTRLRPRVRAAMALAAYQIFFLDRVPPYAAVSEAVSAVRAVSGEKVGGFANALLRKLVAEAARERPNFAEAVRASTARWMLRSLEAALGSAEAATAMVALSAETPPLGLRAASTAERDSWLHRLREQIPNASFEPGTISPLAILALGAGRPSELPGVKEGALVVQEEGSQLVALAAGVREGERVLDACAGRGHKTAIFAEAVGSRGSVDAADLHEAKLDRLREELALRGLRVGETFAIDWSIGHADIPDDYDVVLVDAPCTGTGTIRRRPDILLRRRREDVVALSELQSAIVARAATRVRPGGRLIFAVCSVLREEAEEVIARVDWSALGFEAAPFPGPAARAVFGDRPTARLLPHVHGTDGYFLASFRRPT